MSQRKRLELVLILDVCRKRLEPVYSLTYICRKRLELVVSLELCPLRRADGTIAASFVGASATTTAAVACLASAETLLIPVTIVTIYPSHVPRKNDARRGTRPKGPGSGG